MNVITTDIIQTEIDNFKKNKANYYAILFGTGDNQFGLTVDLVQNMIDKFIAQDLENQEQAARRGLKYTTMLDGFNGNQTQFIQYLLSEQSYTISTVGAAEDLGFTGVLGKLMGIYRHAYIKINSDSTGRPTPFANSINKLGSEYLELNPGGQSDEFNNNKVIGQARIVPGLVAMALHLSGQQHLLSGKFDLQNYRPWENDCQTYISHVQQSMNLLLSDQLKQEEIIHYRYAPRLDVKEIALLKKSYPNGKFEFKDTPQGLNLTITDENGKVVYSIAESYKNTRNKMRPLGGEAVSAMQYFPWVLGQFAGSISKRIEEKAFEMFYSVKDFFVGSNKEKKEQHNNLIEFNDHISKINSIYESMLVNSGNVLNGIVNSDYLGEEKQNKINEIKSLFMDWSKDLDNINKNFEFVNNPLISMKELTSIRREIREDIGNFENKINKLSDIIVKLSQDLIIDSTTSLEVMNKMNKNAQVDLSSLIEKIDANIAEIRISKISNEAISSNNLIQKEVEDIFNKVVERFELNVLKENDNNGNKPEMEVTKLTTELIFQSAEFVHNYIQVRENINLIKYNPNMKIEELDAGIKQVKDGLKHMKHLVVLQGLSVEIKKLQNFADKIIPGLRKIKQKAEITGQRKNFILSRNSLKKKNETVKKGLDATHISKDPYLKPNSYSDE